ncbi:MAG: polyribonucleotide nucleotidyltransferase [Patescibacteria group bacterium]|nr:polyribonucleotide nucleotidyltransferase [Patescibacteria group bacterium]
MDLNRKIYKTELNGEPLSLEISELAHKANAAVLGRHGETVVLATVVMSKKDQVSDFFPLTVDYEERFYAAGKIMGSRFMRREGRPSDEAILSDRLIDRSIRPLFDPRLRREIQVTVTVLAYDEKNDPDAIALIAISTALGISDIPWGGPVAGVKQLSRRSDDGLEYDAFFSGPEERINMIECESNEIEEKEATLLFGKAQEEIKKLIVFQNKIIKEIGKQKEEIVLIEPDPRIQGLVRSFIKDDLEEAIKEKTLGDLKSSLFKHLEESGEDSDALRAADIVFEDDINSYVHKQALEKEERSDGRKLDEVRDLYAEVGLFERTHGSGLFIRGDTQILAATTLAPPSAEQLIETIEMTGKRRFMLHYNFPKFSVGETGRSRGPGRREIGHGALAAKAVRALLPTKDEFPYTIRVVAETLSSNGSSSMASVCATSLSLMDAGVSLKKHIAGIAMGLMIDNNSGEFKVLTDIQGPEDHHGDMDLKVAGTKDGITAIQMDVKVEGITKEMFEAALAQAREARLHILKTMEKTLPAPRPQVSPHAPTILTLNIHPDKIGGVIGPGGKTINGIIDLMNKEITIDIEQEGKVFIAGRNPEMVRKALEIVKQIVKEYKVGEIVEGPIARVLDFGAIVDLGGGRDGMIHVSELKEGFVKNVEEVVKVGDRVKAKVIRVENGKIGLSLKGIK